MLALIFRSPSYIVRAIFASKVTLLVILIVAPRLFPVLFDTPSSISSRFSQWDIQFYLDIAKHGYAVDEDRCAFYPLWPFCIRIGSFFIGGNMLLSAWLLTAMFSLIGMLSFHRLVWLKHGLPLANHATVLLLVYPGSIFFFVPYSESLFLLLLMGCLLRLHEGKYWAAAVPAFLLPLTRPIGIFVMPLLLVELIAKGSCLRKYTLCLAPILGYVSYFAVLYLSTGNLFEGFRAQLQFPTQPSIGRLLQPLRFAQSFTDLQWSHDQLHSIFDRIMFIALLFTLYWTYRLRESYCIYSILAGVIPAISNSLMSFGRFIILVFPLFIVWGHLLYQPRVRLTALMILFGCQIWLLLLFLSGNWAG